MTDTPELNVWRDAISEWSADYNPAEYDNAAAAVIRSYGDERYQAAIADVVEWLLSGERYWPIASEITRRFGKGQDHG